jgi:hypothetical protein
MSASSINFNSLLHAVYGLTLEDRLELKSLLEHNIADSRREEIAANAQKAKEEHKKGNLKFSSNIDELKKML